MMQVSVSASGELSPWWKRSALATMLFGFAILILLTVKAYDNAPPVPRAGRRPFGRRYLHG